MVVEALAGCGHVLVEVRFDARHVRAQLRRFAVERRQFNVESVHVVFVHHAVSSSAAWAALAAAGQQLPTGAWTKAWAVAKRHERRAIARDHIAALICLGWIPSAAHVESLQPLFERGDA